MSEQSLSPTHKKPGGSQLAEQEELLLTAYFDGECGFLSKLRAHRLLRRNAQAQTFLEALTSLSESSLQSFFNDRRQTHELAKVDLWERVSTRIDQEERAAFFLGKRDSTQASSSKEKESFFGMREFFWGGAGAALSFLFVFALSPGGAPQVATESGSSSQAGSTSPVALVSTAPQVLRSSTRVPTVTTVSTHNRPVEVDWMKSDGSVRMIHDTSGRTPIIWVKRRSNLPQISSYRSNSSRRRRNGVQSQSLQQRIPTATLVSK